MDLTKITTPFGLLDEETQVALKEHAGPWEFFDGATWSDIESPNFFAAYVYRVKPKPPEPREWWINVYVDGLGFPHTTRADADGFGDGRIERIRVREVLE